MTLYEIIADDNQTSFWGLARGGTGGYDVSITNDTTIVKRGSDSLKISIITGVYATVGVGHTYTTSQDWSSYTHVAFWFYGVNTGLTWYFRIEDSGGNLRDYSFIDDFSGWKRIVIVLSRNYTESGSLDLSDVKTIYLFTQPASTFDVYLDKMVIEKGAFHAASSSHAVIFYSYPRQATSTIRRKVQKYPVPGRQTPIVVDVGVGDFVHTFTDAKLLTVEAEEFDDWLSLETVTTLYDLPSYSNIPMSIETGDRREIGGVVDYQNARFQLVYSSAAAVTSLAQSQRYVYSVKSDLAQASYTISAGTRLLLLTITGIAFITVEVEGNGSSVFDVEVDVDGITEDSINAAVSAVGHFASNSTIEIYLANNTTSNQTALSPDIYIRGIRFE